MIEIEDITVLRGRREVLSGVCATLVSGQLTAILGPNGSGKSTLLHALTGELTVEKGRITAFDRPLTRHLEKPEALARWRAMLPQQSQLFFDFPVIDVVMMGRSPHIHKRETARDFDICEAALQRVGATHLQNRSFQRLSGGEKQRVHLARVLAQLHDLVEDRVPCLLLLDEPTANLDLKHQHQILRIAREIAAANAAVGVVLHDIQQARELADNVLVLHEGRVAAYGPPGKALTPEILRRVFEVEAHWVEYESAHLLCIEPIESVSQPKHQPRQKV